ncbi:MAG: radical SAM protein [Clostridia bacterium]|nr:radical SAM protein [Clostridia bacterium]
MSLDVTKCEICPNKCGVDRRIATGVCGVNADIRIARADLHFWEEPIVSGEKGSGTIFFSGCNLRCVFCQNYEISTLRRGKTVTVDELIVEIKNLEEKGAENINFVTPTHYAYAVKEALEKYKPRIPVVYNTSAYESVSTLKELEGLVDVYLPDFKYYSSVLSKSLSGRSDYAEVALNAIKEMFRQVGEPTVENGLIKKGVIIRHLVLPGNVEDSVNVLKTVYAEFGEKVWYSIMSQYFPSGRAKEYPPLDRRLKGVEYKAVVAKAEKMGMNNCFIQETSSAKEEYVPEFFGDYPKK